MGDVVTFQPRAERRRRGFLDLIEDYLPCDWDETWEQAQERTWGSLGFAALCDQLRARAEADPHGCPLVKVSQDTAWCLASEADERLLIAWARVTDGAPVELVVVG